MGFMTLGASLPEDGNKSWLQKCCAYLKHWKTVKKREDCVS